MRITIQLDGVTEVEQTLSPTEAADAGLPVTDAGPARIEGFAGADVLSGPADLDAGSALESDSAEEGGK